MVAAYIRFSTEKQEETQQVQALKEWCEPRGITIDNIVKDEGVSGGVSYRDRNLYKLVRQLKAGDILVTSEVSRLGRSMHDLNNLVNDELAPRKVRLIVIKMGLDLDCANLKAMDQMILYSFGFAAEIEKELIQSRTQSAMDARREAIKKDGGFMSKRGTFCDHLGRQKGEKNPTAISAMCIKKAEKAAEWRDGSTLYTWVTIQLLKGKTRGDILLEAEKLYDRDPDKYCTRNGAKLCAGTLSRWAKEILRKG